MMDDERQVVLRPQPLTPDQINTYHRDGILVVHDLLSHSELIEARSGLANTLQNEYGVDVSNLSTTGHNLMNASSTNGAGGVLDIFYPDWKMKIATNERLFHMTCQLWKETYCYSGEKGSDGILNEDEANSYKWHPYGKFDYDRGYMYIDRIGFRIPTKVAENIGEQLSSSNHSDDIHDAEVIHASPIFTTKKNKKKSRPIQRCLTPHFDCCPETYHKSISEGGKWRPIQCFVSLTDNIYPNTGGFEAVPGFHKEFHSWVQRGRRHIMKEDDNSPKQHQQPQHPRPCVGEYTHVHPMYDHDILSRIQHIPVKAGSVVFWDNRIPHGNSFRNDPISVIDMDVNNVGNCFNNDALAQSGARAVVYCSFLPDVHVNRTFVSNQLLDWKLQRPPRMGDRWIRHHENDVVQCVDEKQTPESATRGEKIETTQTLTKLGKQLIGLIDW